MGEGWGEGEPFAHPTPFPLSTPLTIQHPQTQIRSVPRCCTTINLVHTWSQIDGSGQLSSQHLARGTRTNTLTAITGNIKVTESIGGRVGGYNFSPTLVSSGLTRKQCPLYSVKSESSFFGCAGSDYCIIGWSPRPMRTRHHKPIDSARVGTGQSSLRGRVRCQSLFIAGERRRCEPGSNSVIVTNALTSVEGHVLRLGGVLRTRKIFVGCPAIRPFWDQSPARSMRGFETVGNRLYPLHGQDSLCHVVAEVQIQDRSRTKTGLNTAPGFLRVKHPFREAQTPDDGVRKRSDRGGCHSGGGNPEKTKHAIYHPVIPAQPAPYPDTGQALQLAEHPSRGVGQTGTRRLFGLVTTTSDCAKVPKRGR